MGNVQACLQKMRNLVTKHNYFREMPRDFVSPGQNRSCLRLGSSANITDDIACNSYESIRFCKCIFIINCNK